MEYELFKKLIVRRIRDYLPPVFHDYQPTVRQVVKINGTKEAFCMFPPGNPPNVAVPTLYLDDMYESFSYDEDLDRILGIIAGVVVSWSGVEVPELASFDAANHTDRIVANLINREMNEELQHQVPCSDFLDMMVIYRLVHSITDDGINSAIITNDMIEETDLTSDRLWELAMENTQQIFPPRIIESENSGLYVVTNEAGFSGATVMMYPHLLQTLAQKAGGSFYILPTSIHEFFAIPEEDGELSELVRMLAAGNESITSREERLSCSIYHYAADEEQLRIAAGYRMDPKVKKDG